jgi:hypothetical protein
MAKIKKYQVGGKVSKLSKDSVPSEMFPGKMIPKSKSNYDNGNFTKMLEGMRNQNLNAEKQYNAKKAAPKKAKSGISLKKDKTAASKKKK